MINEGNRDSLSLMENSSQEEPSWFVLRVAYHHEQVAKDWLTEVGIDSYLPMHYAEKVTMFANANEEVRSLEIRSRGLRAPCREAPPRCFSWFL